MTINWKAARYATLPLLPGLAILAFTFLPSRYFGWLAGAAVATVFFGLWVKLYLSEKKRISPQESPHGSD